MRLTPIPLLALALVLPGCGDSDSDQAAPPAAKASQAAGDDEAQTFARAAQLRDGSRGRLLEMPIGDLQATCQGGRVRTVFESAKGMATADVVVRSGDTTRDGRVDPGREFRAPLMENPDIQTWSIAEFASGGVRPTVITVAARRGAPGTSYRCAVSAVATVGASTGGFTN